MEKYKRIIEFLNSDDPETIIIGLQYLKESNIKISRSVFTEEENIIQVSNRIINQINLNSHIDNWKILLDMVMDEIISDNPNLIEFHKYKGKVCKLRSLLKLNKGI